MMLRKRILSFIIDYLIIVLPLMIGSFLFVLFEQRINESVFEKGFYTLFLLIILYYVFGVFFKDIIGKRSIGKRIAKIKIIQKNGEKPTYGQVFVRNLTFCIWPVEAILLLLNQERLGDRIAGTKLEEIVGQ